MVATLLSDDTIRGLTALRDRLLSMNPDPPPAGLFVPPVGDRLLAEGGIYYVGAATHGEFGARSPDQTGPAALARIAHMVSGSRHDTSGSPFWRYLDGPTQGLLGGPHEATFARWGWSNLLKIGTVRGHPKSGTLVDEQRELCRRALREELSQLRRTLVLVASGNDFGFARSVLEGFVQGGRLHTRPDAHRGIDPGRGNLLLTHDHPGRAQRIEATAAEPLNGFDARLKRVLELARQRHIP